VRTWKSHDQERIGGIFNWSHIFEARRLSISHDEEPEP